MYNLVELKKQVRGYKKFLNAEKDKGLILYCFGTSFVSKLIRMMTAEHDGEQVPSHVALIYNGFIYESTSSSEKVGNKKIPRGVRRWLLSDFYKAEKNKNTSYDIAIVTIDRKILEKYIHYPYGIDTIVDYALKDGSDGDSKGLICSQYANYAIKAIDKSCCTPAELYRIKWQLN